jgi:diguanylate cyclase (GGDEF)-like protein
MVSDVTDGRRLEDELRRAALHDTLTGLPNRALLFDRLQHALMRETRSTSVLFVDLDQFRHVNEVWGHAVGDELLVRVAARLQAGVRATDTVARFAGDEFLVVCEDVDERSARMLANSLLTALEEPYDVSEGDVRLSASIGVATSPTASAEDLLSHADTAMHAAKAAGRNRVRVFDAGLAADTEDHRLGGDLRRALNGGELSLHHQPVVDLRTGRVVGTEALARWTHPVHGVVSPDRFVSVAERVGLAPELDRWALQRALADARALRARGAMTPDGYVAVNLSAYTLCDARLDAWIAQVVRVAGFAPEEVLLEVTESAVMADAPTAVGVLTRLRQRGFPIAVDDFGTGHSSLAYLRNLPLTTLKIDRSFVAEIATDASARAIVASIVELARAVGLTVVAEGVETPEDAVLLQSLGCDAAQGWLWSRAVSPEEACTTGALAHDYPLPHTP